MRASTPEYACFGPTRIMSVAPTPDRKKLHTIPTNVAFVGTYIEGTADNPPLYGYDRLAFINNSKTWEIRLWAATGFILNTLRLAWWTVATKACPTNLRYELEVVCDPTKRVVWDFGSGIPTGASTAPVGYWDFEE